MTVLLINRIFLLKVYWSDNKNCREKECILTAV
jgi:hypothetical protein